MWWENYWYLPALSAACAVYVLYQLASGKSFVRGDAGWVRRRENPSAYWMRVAVWCVLALAGGAVTAWLWLTPS